MLFPFGILVYHLHHPPQLGVGGSWHCPVGAAHGAALFPLPSWRGTWRGPLGAAHGMALLAWLMAWPSWRGSWCSPVGAACWRSPHGTATRARPPWRSSPHGTALMARPSCWTSCPSCVKPCSCGRGARGGRKLLLACRWAPPRPRFARAGAIPPFIACDIGLSIPSPHVILRVEAAVHSLGPHRQTSLCGQFKQIPLGRPVDPFRAAAPRPWHGQPTWSAGKHCAMAPPTRMLLHVAHIHAVRAHSSGANGFPRGPPISFSESTARSLRTAALFPFQCTSHGENRAMEPTCWVLFRSCPRLGRGGLPLVLQRPFGFPPRRRFRAGRLASALCTPLRGPIRGHMCVGDHRLLWSMGSATRARLRYPSGGEASHPSITTDTEISFLV